MKPVIQKRHSPIYLHPITEALRQEAGPQLRVTEIPRIQTSSPHANADELRPSSTGRILSAPQDGELLDHKERIEVVRKIVTQARDRDFGQLVLILKCRALRFGAAARKRRSTQTRFAAGVERFALGITPTKLSRCLRSPRHGGLIEKNDPLGCVAPQLSCAPRRSLYAAAHRPGDRGLTHAGFAGDDRLRRHSLERQALREFLQVDRGVAIRLGHVTCIN